MKNFIFHYLFQDGLEVIEPDQTHAMHDNQYSIRNSNICHTITKYLDKEKGRKKYSIKEQTTERQCKILNTKFCNQFLFYSDQTL